MQTVDEVAEGGLGIAVGAPALRPVRHDELPARIVSAQVSLGERLRGIWASRELLLFLTRKELKVRYQASVLGFLWSMINPAVVLVTYYLVFKFFLKAQIPYFALMLFSGLLVWNLFSIGVQSAATSVVGAAGIVKKVAFAREVLPLSQVGVVVFFFGLQLIVMTLFLVGFRIAPDWSYLPMVAFALVDLVVLTAGLAVLLSALTVYLRDLEHLVLVMMQAWFWLVPIVYPFAYDVYDNTALPHWVAYLFLADPVTPLVLTFQRAFWGKLGWADPSLRTPYEIHFTYGTYAVMLTAVLAGALLIALLGMRVFSKVEANFAEEL